MIINMGPKEIIKTDQFIREPVDSLSRRLNESSDKKIILNGGRGSGKSTILYNLQDKGLGTKNQAISINFDSIVNFSINPSNLFDKNFFNHYYELEFSMKLLSYIKKNFILTYESNFKDIEELLKSISENTVYYLNNIIYEEVKLKRYLVSNEISAEILERFKKVSDINSLTLIIDRFDWINGSSSYVQEIISKYFDLFDKVIITTDDLSSVDKKRKNELISKGYSFETVTYGKNIDVIKFIIRKRIELYNEISANKYKKFDENIITDKIYSNLINKSNGNIALMLDVLGEFANSLDWKGGFINYLEYEFNIEIDNQLDKIEKIRKIDATPPKLHL